jgi:membrane-bound lytic murein transglycosylase B
MDALMAPDILPTFSLASFTAKGVNLNAAGAAHVGPLALIELQNGDPNIAGNTPSYVAGTDNFYAITRYNWSSYYAMSVIDLGREIAQQMGK